MTTLDAMMADPIIGACLLLAVALSLGVGLYLLCAFADAKHEDDSEHAERWYTDARQLDALRHYAHQAERNRERR